MLEIPTTLIANNPVARGTARLLYRNKSGGLRDCKFSQLADVLPAGALLVLNNTKVFPARIFAAGFEILLLSLPQPCGTSNYRCAALIKPSKKISIGQCLQIDSTVDMTVISRQVIATHPIYQIQITATTDLYAWLERHGNTPLPPYIKNSSSAGKYQTDYAKHSGSVAAPTAGMHFTLEHLSALRRVGIEHCYLTLHVSAGTFLPIRTATPAEHRLLPECYYVPKDTAAKIDAAQQREQAVISVGTTTMRALESFRQLDVPQPNTWYETDLYLHPQSSIHSLLSSGLITNFHQPSSTLFQLISALIGAQETVRMYQHAVEQRYRFYSFGDSCMFDLSQRR